ncbi:MAG TPA: DUF1501 domain-containing protein [Urbifossiella sp.]|nr:DUF1501 domain-containing protein [Urbifossiella sp.]
MTTQRYCRGVSRRGFVRAGVVGGLGLAGYLRAAHAGAVKAPTANAAVFVFLGGGPSHIDTFDPKPDAPAEVRGEFRPIDTAVPGVRVSEHLPRLAKLAGSFAVVRGVSHTLAGHELGTEYLNTGSRPVPSLVYPGYGAVVSLERPGDRELPHFVAVPTTPQKAGYLGVRYAPLQTNAVPQPGVPFTVRGVSLAAGQTVEEFGSRQRLLDELDTTFRGAEADSKLIDGLDRFAHQANDMIRSPRARGAFDVSRERPEVAAAFGTGRFGMSCLLAARLVAAGVRFVTVTFPGWDTHANNFRALKDNLLPQLDQGLAALLANLGERGLLDTTTVYVTGEFGRTPRVNERAGRDHWPRAMTSLLAGGGVRGGQVVGASDANGMGPAGDGYTPDHLAATFYHTLGIDHAKEYHTATGRPVMVVRDGSVIRPLVG